MEFISQKDRQTFENLCMLDASNNHRGDLRRGFRIIQEFSSVLSATI